MVTLLLIFLLSVNEFGAFYTLKDLPENLQYRFYKICAEWNLEIPKGEVLIYETQSLKEFQNITSKTYTIGGLYSKGVIITQPFVVLKRKGLLEKIIIHELLHWVFQKNYRLPKWFEEGFIMMVLKINPQSLKGFHKLCLEKFIKEVKYEDIRLYIDSHRISCDRRNDKSSDASR